MGQLMVGCVGDNSSASADNPRIMRRWHMTAVLLVLFSGVFLLTSSAPANADSAESSIDDDNDSGDASVEDDTKENSNKDLLKIGGDILNGLLGLLQTKIAIFLITTKYGAS